MNKLSPKATEYPNLLIFVLIIEINQENKALGFLGNFIFSQDRKLGFSFLDS
ncbi:hypothetical protein H1P_1360004 [Hyella patelloides LEGE 07179]|uniref:Uncharacterized protein n=1 Tax=Hyella patelloides LEGE 07179 TaxID=945734 RepID=A0A563VL07_9CYAN|nr:hypothetical protein H1P_1360004 [Hyella patelloides LEGE 07179]